MSLPPIVCEWTGEAFEPRPAFRKRCDEALTVHELYRVETREERSINSHRHFFAAVEEAWRNLPDGISDRFATSEHLRKWCLIKTGYRDQRTFVCKGKAEAQRLAAFIRPMDDYAVIAAREATVIVATAKSQSMKAMGKQAFQESKTAVLDECARLIGTSAAALKENVRTSA